MPSNTPDGRIRRRRRLGAATLLGYPVMAGCIAFVHFGWAWAVTAALPGYLPFMVLGYSRLRHRPRKTIAGLAAVALIGLIWPMQLRYYRAIGLRPRPEAPHELPKADSVQITLRRDSVAMGDDTEAPHEESCQVPPDRSLADVLSHVLGEGYLAIISGGKATWVLESAGSPLAVIAQQWSDARYLTDPHQRIATLADQSGAVQLFFRYRLQEDPDAVFADLQPA